MFLTADNYYSAEANKHYLSVSQYKDFLTCEAMAMAKLNQVYIEEKSDALMVGSYVDSWCEGTLEQFKEINSDYLYDSRNKKEKILLKKFKQADEIINIIKSDINMMAKLTGEKQVIFTTNMFGASWKIKMDCYNPDAGFFSDLKVMSNLHDKFYNKETQTYDNFIEHYKYHFQMCIYAMVEKSATKRKKYLKPYIVAVTKEPVADKGIFDGFLSEIETVTWHIEEHLPRILLLKQGKETPIGCGRCDYCKSIKIAEIQDYHYLRD